MAYSHRALSSVSHDTKNGQNTTHSLYYGQPRMVSPGPSQRKVCCTYKGGKPFPDKEGGDAHTERAVVQTPSFFDMLHLGLLDFDNHIPECELAAWPSLKRLTIIFPNVRADRHVQLPYASSLYHAGANC